MAETSGFVTIAILLKYYFVDSVCDGNRGIQLLIMNISSIEVFLASHHETHITYIHVEENRDLGKHHVSPLRRKTSRSMQMTMPADTCCCLKTIVDSISALHEKGLTDIASAPHFSWTDVKLEFSGITLGCSESILCISSSLSLGDWISRHRVGGCPDFAGKKVRYCLFLQT